MTSSAVVEFGYCSASEIRLPRHGPRQHVTWGRGRQQVMPVNGTVTTRERFCPRPRFDSVVASGLRLGYPVLAEDHTEQEEDNRGNQTIADDADVADAHVPEGNADQAGQA